MSATPDLVSLELVPFEEQYPVRVDHMSLDSDPMLLELKAPSPRSGWENIMGKPTPTLKTYNRRPRNIAARPHADAAPAGADPNQAQFQLD
jgi:hypothetical protein